jgi:hypothetical protein
MVGRGELPEEAWATIALVLPPSGTRLPATAYAGLRMPSICYVV